VRFLLDAHLSRRFVAEPVRRDGHDVRSLQEERALDGLGDEDVLALAASEERILVTRNSRDFAPLTRKWIESGREHSGCVLIWLFQHDEYASIVGGIERLVATTRRPRDWKNLVLAL
jgi:hypothetical protein